jgi:hypothetical protein
MKIGETTRLTKGAIISAGSELGNIQQLNFTFAACF